VSSRSLSAFEGLFFIIESAGLESPLIHLTSAISLRLYAWRRHIISIIRRFSYVVPNLTRQSYNNLESVQRTSGRLIFRALLIVVLREALILKP
jgi:hypothetical protein